MASAPCGDRLQPVRAIHRPPTAIHRPARDSPPLRPYLPADGRHTESADAVWRCEADHRDLLRPPWPDPGGGQSRPARRVALPALLAGGGAADRLLQTLAAGTSARR